MDTRSAYLQNDIQVSSEIIQPKKTSNYDYRDNIPNENNCEHIKNSKYPNCRETSAKVYSFSKNSFLKI